jgi:PhnB protein
MQTKVHLNFKGDCDEALRFYEKALGAKRTFSTSWGDSPMAKDAPKGWDRKIMHATIRIGDAEIMAADSPPDRYQPMTGFSMSLNVATPKEADKVFTTLSEGAKVTMPLQETFWAQSFGMLTDKFGVPWMVNCSKGK